LRVADRREIDDADAFFKLFDECGGDLQRESSLARTAGPGQRQQSDWRVRGQQALPGQLDFSLTPEDWRGLNGQVVSQARTRVSGRGLVCDLLSHRLFAG
jgi:hypothetical protein